MSNKRIKLPAHGRRESRDFVTLKREGNSWKYVIHVPLWLYRRYREAELSFLQKLPSLAKVALREPCFAGIGLPCLGWVAGAVLAAGYFEKGSWEPWGLGYMLSHGLNPIPLAECSGKFCGGIIKGFLSFWIQSICGTINPSPKGYRSTFPRNRCLPFQTTAVWPDLELQFLLCWNCF